MNQVPTKIVLKSTTRMSLNDRFSTIMPNVQTMRANRAAEHQVSTANRRLAQQLSNRPGIPQNQVNNMMMYNSNSNNNNNMNMMMRGQGRGRRGSGAPIQNRVGRGNIKARLTLPPMTRGGAQRGGRGGGAGFNQNFNNNAMTSPLNKPRGRGVLSTRSPRGRGGMRGGRGQQFNRDGLNDFPMNRRGAGNSFGFRGGRHQQQRSRGQGLDRFTGQATGRGAVNQRGGVRGRGGFNNRGGNNQNNNSRGGRYFNRGGRGGGRGGRGAGGPKSSMQDLDSQLDQYMAKTKSSLDSELDSYMAQVSTD